MPALLQREEFDGLRIEVDEGRARAQLRRQIGRLESELAGLFGEAFGRTEVSYRVGALAAEPRILDLGELERVRDELADRVAESRLALRERAEVETRNRELLRQMLASPADYKGLVVTRNDVGEPGCGTWQSRPRLGPIGMLMGWWRVKVSSGCPLAGRLTAVEREVEAKAREETGSAEEGARAGAGRPPGRQP
jgi:hypothetical protein